ncbi:MAG TPA: alanine racemase, partial [Chloroflexia bacterium]|nr:alanine racemase [Chloroflexia bacterium]
MVSVGEPAAGDVTDPVAALQKSGRPLSAEIDLSAIAANTRAIKALVGPRCRVMAVVKADGYGLGARWVALAALEGGASWLGVACVDEGVQLRRAGYGGPILVMSYASPDEAEAAVRNRLTLVLHRERTALALEAAASRLGLPAGEVAVHIKVDTGLGRYGCLPHEFLALAQAIGKLPHLRLEGLMTHFADADNPDLTFARSQLAIFNDVRAQAAEHGIVFELVHAANSAAALSLPEARFDMVRCGIMLSGHFPSPHLRGQIELKPALTLRSTLGRVYEAPRGATVGYGRTWTAMSPALIGLVPLGYADGYRRALSNQAQALVGGRRVPVVGRVSMDQIGLDLTGVPDAQEGDEVVLVGAQGHAAVTVDDLAEWAGTI